MTTSQVGEKAGLTSGMISQLETGRAAYTQNSLERVALALDVEPWCLLCREPMHSNHFWELLTRGAIWREVPEDKRDDAAQLLKKQVELTVESWRLMFKIDDDEEATPR